jgi:GT2 family glycosyltransferase
MKVSVILSVYGRPDLLRLALISVGHQTRLADEVVIIDDGSECDIAASVAEYAGSLPFASVKHVRQEDRGFRLARSRNNGIREAAGDYLVFWDQDTVATPGYLGLYCREARPGQFLVALPVELTEAQSGRVGPETVALGDYSGLLTEDQLKRIRRQFVKDSFYHQAGRVLGRKWCRPKLRGGCFGISRDDLLLVNGFDENYRGWGAEDDDLGRRLYRAGIVGKTVFRDDYPIHLWHPHRTGGQDSPNLPYYNRRLREIASGEYLAVNGLTNPLDEDVPAVKKIK